LLSRKCTRFTECRDPQIPAVGAQRSNIGKAGIADASVDLGPDRRLEVNGRWPFAQCLFHVDLRGDTQRIFEFETREGNRAVDLCVTSQGLERHLPRSSEMPHLDITTQVRTVWEAPGHQKTDSKSLQHFSQHHLSGLGKVLTIKREIRTTYPIHQSLAYRGAENAAMQLRNHLEPLTAICFPAVRLHELMELISEQQTAVSLSFHAKALLHPWRCCT